MSPLATVETDKPVSGMIAAIDNENKRKDSERLLKLFEKVTGQKGKVWGDNFIIGFGKYTYTRKGSKEELEWFPVGFAPRKSNLTIYLTYDVSKQKETLGRLGKCKYGKGCLYINKLDDVDLDVLGELIEMSKDSRWM